MNKTFLLALVLLSGARDGFCEPRDFSRRLIAHPEDFAERCPKALNFADFGGGGKAPLKADEAMADPDLKALSTIFGLDAKNCLREFTVFTNETDYYARRAEVRRKASDALAALVGSARLKAENNYSSLLVSLGEFQEVIDDFGPKSGRRAATEKEGRIQFNLAQSYFRGGRYREARPYAEAARSLLPEDELDTLWQMMLVDLGDYGRDFPRRHSKAYTLTHVKKLFPNEDPSRLPFEDATAQTDIRRWGGTGGAAFADFDGDGWDDLLFTPKYFPPQLYKNDHGRFRSTPRKNLGNGLCTPLVATVADYDNDGKLDIFRACCNFDGPGPAILHKNEGGLLFQDVTREAKLDYKGVSGMHNAWGDYDLDGNLDVAVADMFGATRLYHNDGDGTFTETTKSAGILTPGGGGDFGAVTTAFGDYDADGYPDLFAQGWGWKKLYHNNGDGTFTDVTLKAGIDSGEGRKGYNAFFFDYDNDGRLDILASQYVTSSGIRWGYGMMCLCSNLLKPGGYSEREWAAAATIYRNNGDGTFTNMHEKTRFIPLGVMGIAHGDWNNDGYEDVVMGTGGPFTQQIEPTMFYQNNGDGTFSNLTTFTDFGLWGKGHGLAFADYDHDGNLDLFLAMGGLSIGDAWPSMLLHNKGNERHWLEVALKGAPGTNVFGVGAQVRVYTKDRQQLMELSSGGNFSGSSTFRLHFGLASSAKVDRLEVTWPNKSHAKTVLRDVSADQAIEIEQTGGTYRRLWNAPRTALLAPK